MVHKNFNPKITIIVTTYNCAEYISRCIHSILAQNYPNIEIIIVDDGSTDETGIICETYVAQDRRIKLIRQANSGVSIARNAGLNCATGDYITFVDADDYIDKDMIGNYLPYIIKSPNSILISGHRRIYSKDKIISICYREYTILSISQALRILFEDNIKSFQNFLWNKLYPRALFEKIRFGSERIFEDIAIQYKLFEIADTIVLCPFVGYNYVIRKTSLTHFQQNHFDFVDVQIERFIHVNRYIHLHLNLLSALIFRSYIEGVHISKITVPKSKSIAHSRYNTEIKIKSIASELKKYLPKYKFYFMMASLKKNIFTELLIEIAWITNKVLNMLHIRQIPSEFFDNISKSMNHYNKTNTNIEYNKNTIVGYDKKNKQILIHSYSVDPQSFLEKFCQNLRIAYHTRLKCKAGASARYEHYEWLSCDTAAEKQLSASGATFSLGKKVYHDSIPMQAVRRFFRNKLNWLPWCRTDGSWILMDRDTQADDNAEHLYRWLRHAHPEKKAFFALRRTSHDWQRLEAEGFALVDIASPAYLRRRLCASVVASSHFDSYVFRPVCSIRRSTVRKLGTCILNRIFRFIKKDCAHIFLQHGVTMNDVSPWLNCSPISLLVTATPAERHAITGDAHGFRYSEKDVVLTGFPRHDALVAHVGATPARPRITFMPTWRGYLVGESLDSNTRLINPDFMQSAYARAWQHLLAGEGLRRLWHAHGFDIVFFPHVNIQPYLSQFDLPDYVRPVTHADTRIQDLFLSTSLLVTDYSSVAFEMAFLLRPVIYYQFDKKDFFSGNHVVAKGYFHYDKEGFGPVVTEEDQLLNEIEISIGRNYAPQETYLERMRNAFAYRDGNNCARVYAAIAERDVVISDSL